MFNFSIVGGRGHRGPSKGKDVVHQLPVSLDDMYNGTTRRLSLNKNVICDKCDGRGGKPGATQTCPMCRGQGVQVKIHQIGPGMVQQVSYFYLHYNLIKISYKICGKVKIF